MEDGGESAATRSFGSADGSLRRVTGPASWDVRGGLQRGGICHRIGATLTQSRDIRPPRVTPCTQGLLRYFPWSPFSPGAERPSTRNPGTGGFMTGSSASDRAQAVCNIPPRPRPPAPLSLPHLRRPSPGVAVNAWLFPADINPYQLGARGEIWPSPERKG